MCVRVNWSKIILQNFGRKDYVNIIKNMIVLFHAMLSRIKTILQIFLFSRLYVFKVCKENAFIFLKKTRNHLIFYENLFLNDVSRRRKRNANKLISRSIEACRMKEANGL